MVLEIEGPLVTVHPLGGAVMGEDAASGVVDERGRVFAGTSGEAVHDGLYVCDGSIVPRSLGANPLLTICALAPASSRTRARPRPPHAAPAASASARRITKSSTCPFPFISTTPALSAA